MLLKTTKTGALTVFALDRLAEQEHCCPACCSGCWVLWEMKMDSDLDVIIRKVPPRFYENHEWWDQRSDTVRKDWLMEKWDYDCPQHTEEED